MAIRLRAEHNNMFRTSTTYKPHRLQRIRLRQRSRRRPMRATRARLPRREERQEGQEDRECLRRRSYPHPELRLHLPLRQQAASILMRRAKRTCNG